MKVRLLLSTRTWSRRSDGWVVTAARRNRGVNALPCFCAEQAPCSLSGGPCKSPGKVWKEKEQPVESSWFLWGIEVVELVALRDKNRGFFY